MKRLLFPAFLIGAAGAGILFFAACDPDLGIVTKPGEPGTEGGAASDAPVTQPSDDGGPTSETGPDEGGTEGGTDSGTTHKVDGVNDFAPGEKLQTSSSATNYFGYAAWDAKNVYFGMEGSDVSSATPDANNKWVMVYIGRTGVAGTTTGLSYNGAVQQPTLPFSASIHLRWKVDGSYGNVQEWSVADSMWKDAPLIPLTVVRQGSFMEMGISRAALGMPAKIQVTMNMLIEKPGSDFTYAGVPSTTFGAGGDRLDPDFTKFYEFDLADLVKAPNTYAAKP
jgi:hypothetical protein